MVTPSALAPLLLAALLTPAVGPATPAPVTPASAPQEKVLANDVTVQPGGMLLDITLERRRNGKVESMASGHVFQDKDQVRLRLKSHYNGYLYVMDQGTSGRFATVFPSMDAGKDNRIMDTNQYLVPAGDDDWFDISGPAGFDTLYFLLSPTPLAQPSASSFTAPGPASSLKPRCNDKIFRARGECMDDNAGPATLPSNQPLPAPLAPIAGGASRDLTFSNKEKGTVGVNTKGKTDSGAPLIYTFRLAHQ